MFLVLTRIYFIFRTSMYYSLFMGPFCWIKESYYDRGVYCWVWGMGVLYLSGSLDNYRKIVQRNFFRMLYVLLTLFLCVRSLLHEIFGKLIDKEMILL